MTRPDAYDTVRTSPAMRRARLYAVLTAYGALISLGAWANMLVVSVVFPDDGPGYPAALFWTAAGVLTWEGIHSLYRFIRDGVR